MASRSEQRPSATIPSAVVVTSDWLTAHVLNVSWTDASSDETSFQVQRRVRPDGGAFSNYVRVATPGESVTGYADSDVVQSAAYQYRVRACNAVGCSAFVVGTVFVAGTSPAAPTTVIATATGTGTLDVTWVDASDIETRSAVLREIRWVRDPALVPVLERLLDVETDPGLIK
jgi:hypothetical protein